LATFVIVVFELVVWISGSDILGKTIGIKAMRFARL
jgi:hypothetical protein